jgi:hypothetical protein
MQSKVLACEFQDNNTLVTCGVDHIYFWDVKSKTKKKGLFGKAPGVKLQSLVSLASLDKGAQMATGTASGHIYAWQGRNCIKAVKAHEVLLCVGPGVCVVFVWGCGASRPAAGSIGTMCWSVRAQRVVLDRLRTVCLRFCVCCLGWVWLCR